MKNKILGLLIGLSIILLVCQAQTVDKDLNEFAVSFSSTNIKLRGRLLLIGEYKGDLSRLTYENYISLLEKNETSSSKETIKTIKEANPYLFISKKNSFQIVLYLKKFNAIVFDDANTFGSDSIKILKDKEDVPNLTQLINKSK